MNKKLLKLNNKFIVMAVIMVFIFNYTFTFAEEAPSETSAIEPGQTVITEPLAVETPLIENESAANNEAATTDQGSVAGESEKIQNTESDNTTGNQAEATEENSGTDIIIIEGNASSTAGQIAGESETAPEQNVEIMEPAVFDFSAAEPAPAGARAINSPSYGIVTGIIRKASLKGLALLAQWPMKILENNQYQIADDSALNGSQFLPSGKFETALPFAVCALVADNNGAGNISEVTAQVNYPKNTAKSLKATGEKTGCGGEKTKVILNPVANGEAINLICDQLRNNNNNLLAWGADKPDNLIYSYDQICGQDGLLAKESARLFCAETSLAYDDPAGNYLVKVTAKNSQGAEAIGESPLEYLELTTFENDFTSIQYGLIGLNELKTLAGNEIFGDSARPTIRNTGNTRLTIKIWQNDFNLGQTGDQWNLAYQARVGDRENFSNYWPEETASLNKAIELGQTINADFSVLVKKFPEADGKASFAGLMTLSADKAPALTCQ